MSTTTHKCIIAVSEQGDAILVSSSPSLIESGQFESSFLKHNIDDTSEIPKDPGVYNCEIVCKWSSRSDLYSGGLIYDIDAILQNAIKIDL